MLTTFKEHHLEERILANLFDNLSPFVPETPKLKAQEYLNEIYFNEMEGFCLDENSPPPKIKRITKSRKEGKRWK